MISLNLTGERIRKNRERRVYRFELLANDIQILLTSASYRLLALLALVHPQKLHIDYLYGELTARYVYRLKHEIWGQSQDLHDWAIIGNDKNFNYSLIADKIDINTDKLREFSAELGRLV